MSTQQSLQLFLTNFFFIQKGPSPAQITFQKKLNFFYKNQIKKLQYPQEHLLWSKLILTHKNTLHPCFNKHSLLFNIV